MAVKIPTLSGLSVEEREKSVSRLWEDAVEYRRQSGKEDAWLNIYQLLRGVEEDKGSQYAATMRHPYAYTAGMAIHAALWPALLSAEPPFQIVDPNPDNERRNRMMQRILTAQLTDPGKTNFRAASDNLMLDFTFYGCAAAWVHFKSQSRRVGPFYEPLEMPDGMPILDDKLEPIIRQNYRNYLVYHAPWVEHIVLWDFFAHPGGIWNFVVRDTSGRELLAQSQGINPIYDPERVNRMLATEARLRENSIRNSGSFQSGDVRLQERDALARAAGVTSPREAAGDMLSTAALQSVLDLQYPIYHISGEQGSGSYAVADNRWYELRWTDCVAVDGTSNILFVNAAKVPQELYAAGIFETAFGLLEANDKFHRAAMDGAALTVLPMWAMSETMRSLNPELIVSPGGVLSVPSDGMGIDKHLQRLDMPQSWMNAIGFLQYITSGLDMAFGSNDLMRGRFPEGRKTAMLVQQVAQGAEGRLRVLYQRVKDQFLTRIIKKFAAFNAVHLTGADYERYLGPEAVSYDPPDPQEIVENLSFVPMGSLDSANSALRAGRWQAVLGMMLQALPYLRLKPVNEVFRRWLEDMDMPAISQVMPVADDTIPTEYLMMQKGGGGGAPAEPPEPEDMLSGEMGGAMAPPGPMNGGMNGGGMDMMTEMMGAAPGRF